MFHLKKILHFGKSPQWIFYSRTVTRGLCSIIYICVFPKN